MLTAELLHRYVRARGRFLYHVTDTTYISSILRRGLIPQSGQSQFAPSLLRPGHVYLCNRITALRSLAGHFDCSWGDVALRVDVLRLSVKRFNTDEEYWRGYEYPDGRIVGSAWADLRRAFPKIDEPHEVYSCLLHFGSVAYGGSISPENLEVCRAPGPYRLEDQRLRPYRQPASATVARMA